MSSPSGDGGPRPKKARRSVKKRSKPRKSKTMETPLLCDPLAVKANSDEHNASFLIDSGSEEADSDAWSEGEEAYDILAERANTRRIREEAILYVESEKQSTSDNDVATVRECDDPLTVEVKTEDIVLDAEYYDKLTEEVIAEKSVNGAGADKGLEQSTLGQVYNGLEDFTWSEDFSLFSGKAETYLRSPGPTVETQDPVEIFMTVFDSKIMNDIVRETNRYAWQIISQLSETENGIPVSLQWTETSVSEMYRYFAALILMSVCYRARVRDYWTTGILEMPEFRKIMSRNRFLTITKFLHFIDNERCDKRLSQYEKKIIKIRPIVDHCNMKFGSLYTPSKHLSLDESLLLWKGNLSWVQCIRTKAARFGIKSYELCEAATGYQLKYLLYAGKASTMCEEEIHGFESCSAKIVLELMDGFLDVGHTLVMDNWYNQLPLMRFLKRRRTDVIGTINRNRLHIPDDIKQINELRMARGRQISRHCGDISLVAWKDVKLVTAASTFHSDRQLPARRAGVDTTKPEAILEYNQYMGGVDSKDQKLSMYLMERKRGRKWYIKVFKRLLNTSLLNSYIIYTRNPVLKTLTHRDFRTKVALDLLNRFPLMRSPRKAEVNSSERDRLRLMKADHFVEHTAKIPGKHIHKQKRCVRCTAAGRRTMVTLFCSFCKVALCAGPCWAEYHSLLKFPDRESFKM